MKRLPLSDLASPRADDRPARHSPDGRPQARETEAAPPPPRGAAPDPVSTAGHPLAAGGFPLPPNACRAVLTIFEGQAVFKRTDSGLDQHVDMPLFRLPRGSRTTKGGAS